MSNPQGPVNAEFFNRIPKRESHDVIIDSANRNKVEYPESNNFKIQLPICAIKQVRNVGVFFMTLVKTEKTIHGSKVVGGNANESYSEGNQKLAFNEGIRIYPGNQTVKFRLNYINYEVRLPTTLQSIYKVSQSNDRICVTTPGPHNYLVGQTVQMIGYPYVANCASFADYTDPNTEYEVVEITAPNIVYLLAVDRRFSAGDECCLTGDPLAQLPPLGVCDTPRLLFGPLQDQEDLADLTQSIFNAQQQCSDNPIHISVVWNPDQGLYTIDSSIAKEPFTTPTLLHEGTESYVATIPVGDYSEAELATALQVALNQPLVKAGVNDKLQFQELNSSVVHTIQLAPGTYTPETLAFELQTLMNNQPGITNTYCVCYDPVFQGFSFSAKIMTFTLFFSRDQGTAALLGFCPIDQGSALSYESQNPVYSPQQQITQQQGKNVRSNNLYSVHYDNKQRVYTIILNGQPSNYLLTVTPCTSGGASIVETAHPHGLDVEDIVFVNDEQAAASGIINAGLYVVEQVLGSRRVVLNMTICPEAYTDPSLPIPLAPTISFGSIPLPFNIDFSQPHSPILDLLGIVPSSKQSQTVYRSTRDCLHCQPLYLLVEIPEFLNSRLWAQYKYDGPPQKFFARLDADFEDHTYTLTQVPEPIHEDLFIGTALNLTTITIRIWKPDGTLYDTNRCDWSMWLRLVGEK